MKVITIANQKGGVGKTTSVLNFGRALARKGYRVLLIDSDPQGNLTSYLGVEMQSSVRTLDELYTTKRPLDQATRRQFVTPAGENLWLIAGESALANVEYYLFNRPDRETVLATFLEGLRTDFDFVLIDTPPSLTLLTINALSASDWVIVPMQTEFFSLEGVVKIRSAVENVQNRWNSKLQILGYLPTQVNRRRKLTVEVLETLSREFGEKAFKTAIHDSAAVAESSGHAQSVIDYDRSSQGAKDYLAAADEILERLESRATVATGLRHEEAASTVQQEIRS